MAKDFSQLNIDVPQKKLDDFFKIDGGILSLRGVLQTENFISGKRGVQIKNEGLSSSGGVIQGATIGGSSTSISGTLTHTGSAVGLNGATPVARASAIGQITDSTGGSPDGTLQNVGASFNQTILNNNFADLAAKLNAIETAIKNIGISS
jgi:hypothetical protein